MKTWFFTCKTFRSSYLQWHFSILVENRHIKHKTSQQMLKHGWTQMSTRQIKELRDSLKWHKKLDHYVRLTCTVPWDTPLWCLFGLWWRLAHETGDRWCVTWSRSLLLCDRCQQIEGHIWWWAAAQQNTGSGSKQGPSLWCWKQPGGRRQRLKYIFHCLFFLQQLQLCVDAYCVQRGSSSHVREKSNLQDMEQEILVVNTVHSVQEKDHGSFVIWHKTSWHLWFYDTVV